MIQLQSLMAIISRKDDKLLTSFGVEYYKNYEKEYLFIKNHYDKYNQILDMATFLSEFPDLSPIDVTESNDYICNKLYEEYVYNKSVDIINSSEKLFSEDAVKAKNYIIKELSSISKKPKTHKENSLKNIRQEMQAFLSKKESYISTGLDELDEILQGGVSLDGELLLLLARTNMGKSWIALKMSIEANKAGKNVGFWSPEMTKYQCYSRILALSNGVSAHGTYNLKNPVDDSIYDDIESYKGEYLLEYKNFDLDAIEPFIVDNDLDILFIDGLKYIKGFSKLQEYERLDKLSAELLRISIKTGVPIVCSIQSNRGGIKSKKDEELFLEDFAPTTKDLSGSDALLQNATRVLAIGKDLDTYILKTIKNRFGPVEKSCAYIADLDKGKFVYYDGNVGMPKEHIYQQQKLQSLYDDFLSDD